MTSIEIRRTVGGWDEVADLVALAFGGEFGDREHVDALHEPERSIGAYSKDELVGHTGIWSLDLRVPGRTVPVAGVTMVSVRPTHRRQGILSRLMKQQLHELHEQGLEPTASLSASEPAIYGRFGYGLTGYQASVEIPRSARALRPVAGIDEVVLRYADAAKTKELCAGLHDAALADRPGSFLWTEPWQNRLTADPESTRHGASKLKCVLAERAGDVTGFAYFRTRQSWGEGGPDGTVEVRRVHATDLASHAALWRFLLDQDLMQRTSAELAPDDPVLTLLVDPRQARARLGDGIWTRVVDVDRALADRRYAFDVELVLEVRDELCPWNAGRWRLVGGPDGAECTRVTDSPDLVLDVRELGATYLGGRSFSALTAAGLVEEVTSGSAAVATRAFASDLLPWRDTMF